MASWDDEESEDDYENENEEHAFRCAEGGEACGLPRCVRSRVPTGTRLLALARCGPRLGGEGAARQRPYGKGDGGAAPRFAAVRGWAQLSFDSSRLRSRAARMVARIVSRK
jgi:hypothetical protein